jgi:hypothetical protein
MYKCPICQTSYIVVDDVDDCVWYHFEHEYDGYDEPYETPGYADPDEEWERF